MKRVQLTEDRLVDLRYDKIFKAVFTQETEASRKALRSLLEATLQRSLDIVTVIANEPAAQSATDRQIRYDIACTFNSGELANIEMTLWPKGGEPFRIEYFLSRLFASQDIRGREFSELKRSYQISILGDKLYRDRHAVHSFEYYDQDQGIALGGLTSVITLELEKLEELVEKPLEAVSGQERWGLFLRYAAEPERLNLVNRLLEMEEGIAMAGEAILELPQSQVEEMRRISRDKYLMDQAQAAYDLRCLTQERDAVMQERDAIAQERDTVAQELNTVAQERDAITRELHMILQERDSMKKQLDLVFQELAELKKQLGK
ncbi:MAG: PD-(D/E)XK nuclease family transposase [Spirochaetaceae bacterium]|jgi:predicted transposase/invertase (TIGR01784 family)|nr:PD-(D/E)XK nuclease family transposase [Spirochaetaceae bacterium]